MGVKEGFAVAALRGAVAGLLEGDRSLDENALAGARRARRITGWRLDLFGDEDDCLMRALCH